MLIALIKDKAEGEAENIDPNIHNFKIQRIEALIKSEIDEDIQSMTYKNQLNENHIKKLEKELDLSNLDLNLMRYPPLMKHGNLIHFCYH